MHIIKSVEMFNYSCVVVKYCKYIYLKKLCSTPYSKTIFLILFLSFSDLLMNEK